MPSAVHPISSTHVDAQFSHAVAHGPRVAKIAGLHLAQPGRNSGPRHLVAEAANPFRVGFTPILLLVTDEFDHGISVA
jgi:hypothetical protein